MQRPPEYHHVLLRVGVASLDGTVVATNGDEVTVHVHGGLRKIVPPRPAPARLLFQGARHPVVVDGRVLDDAPERLRFRADGTIDPREHARLAVVLPVVVTPADGVPVVTSTVDVSGSGALLGIGGLAGDLGLSFTLPNGERLDTRGRVVRADERQSAVTFGHHARMGEFVLAVRGSLADRFAQRR